MRDKRLKALTEQRDALIEQLETIVAGAVNENGEERALTEEEQNQFNDLNSKIENLNNSIKIEERARDLEMQKIEAPKEDKNESTTDNATAEERAFADYIRGVVSEERANLAVTDGQVTIPSTIANKIITKVYDICPVARMATRYNVKGTLDIPFYPATALGGTPDITMAYASEFTDLESTSGKFSSITLQGHLAGVMTKISKSLINNSQFNIVDFVVNQMAENIARWVELQLLVGDHANSRIDGLSQVSLVKETAAANAITADELIDVQGLIKDAFQANACWIMSPSTRDAIRKLKDGEDRYLLNPDFRDGYGYKLLGKQVYISDNMPNMGAGNIEIYYGDFSGLALKVSEELNIEVLREVFAAQHAIGVVGWMECDAKIENAQKIAALVGKA